MNKNILCLDTGTITGYAALLVNGTERSGVESFKTKSTQSKGMKFLHFERWLRHYVKKNQINIIIYEQVRAHKGCDAAHSYGGFIAIMQHLCEVLGVEYEGLAVGTIKKAFTGKGNANKNMMVTEAFNRGYTPVDDNEADAIAIREFVKENWEFI